MWNYEGEMLKLSTGVLPAISPLENKLNAILHGLKKAFDDEYNLIILETDNLDAFKVIKKIPNEVPQEVAEVAQQIHRRLDDSQWICSIVYVFLGRNQIATYLARLGGERCNRLYTLKRPIGAVEELLSLDLGFGHISPQFQDVVIYSDEDDPVDFGLVYLQNKDLIFGGYAFHEDYFTVDNNPMEARVVLPVHEVEMEDIVHGKGYKNWFQNNESP